MYFRYFYMSNTTPITRREDHTDNELLLLIQHGDKQAFSLLYHRYYLLLCNKAYKHLPEEGAVEEVVQDVFVALWTKANTLDALDNVSAWLFAALRKSILHELRHEYTRRKYDEQLKQLPKIDYQQSDDEIVYAKETEEKIHGVINTLSPQCREAFILSRFERMSYKDIAQQMNISVKTVEKHISKALQVLREELKEYELPMAIILLSTLCI